MHDFRQMGGNLTGDFSAWQIAILFYFREFATIFMKKA